MSPRPTTRWPTSTPGCADHVRSPSTRNKGDRGCWQRVPRHPRRGAQPVQALASCARAGERWKSWSRSSSAGRRRDQRSGADPPLQATSSIWERSCSASATHSMRGSRRPIRRQTTSRRCALLAHCHRSHRRHGRVWSQTLRRIVEVGQMTDALTETETIELYAQLGASRRCARPRRRRGRRVAPRHRIRTRATCARWRPSRVCSRVGPVGGVDRTVLEKARSSSTTGPAPREPPPGGLTWEEKVETSRRPRRSTRRVRASDRPTSPRPTARSDLLAAVQVGVARRGPPRAQRVRPDVPEQIAILNRVAKSTSRRIGTRVRVLRAASRVQSATTRMTRPHTSSSASPRRPTLAGAARE